ncbi:MAG: OadG family protein [Eubacteriales bacterium]|nr:OadG family protein [Eubacteriales bacterium]
MGISPWFVLCLGMGTVFVGLYILILLTKWMSAVVRKIDARKAKEA